MEGIIKNWSPIKKELSGISIFYYGKMFKMESDENFRELCTLTFKWKSNSSIH